MSESQSVHVSSASALDRNLSARQLSTAHVTRVQNLERSPRWLHLLLPWVNVGGGVFRVNRRRLVSSRFGGVLFTGEGNAIHAVPESLRALPGFSQATEAQLQELAGQFERHTQPDGAEFALPENTLALVATGAVQQRTGNGAARFVRHLFAAPGQHFVVATGPGGKGLQAVGTTTLLTLPPEQVARSPWLQTALTPTSQPGVNQYGEAAIQVLSSVDGEPKLPTTFVDYQDHPREYYIHSIQTVLRTHTRITDLYSNEFDQLREQVRVVIDVIREREEWELLNNPEFGLLNETAIAQRVPTRGGPPTPDDLDELLTKCGKSRAFSLPTPKPLRPLGGRPRAVVCRHRPLRCSAHPLLRGAVFRLFLPTKFPSPPMAGPASCSCVLARKNRGSWACTIRGSRARSNPVFPSVTVARTSTPWHRT